MIAKVNSSAVLGVNAYKVEVEVNISKGLPSYSAIVGLPDSAVKESKERVEAAIKNSGFEFPRYRITVNLAPADIKKEGSNFDLPIAIGILSAQGIIPKDRILEFLILGELSLNGELHGVRGMLPIAIAASKLGLHKMTIPSANKNEAAVDFSDVTGQEGAKRALEVAAAGSHNVLSLWSQIYLS